MADCFHSAWPAGNRWRLCRLSHLPDLLSNAARTCTIPMNVGSEKPEICTTARASLRSIAVVSHEVQESLRCFDQQLVAGLPILDVHERHTVRWIVVYGFDHLLQPDLNPLHRYVFVHANVLCNVEGLGQHGLASHFHAFGDAGLRLGSSRILDDRRQQREVSSTGAHLMAELFQARTASHPILLIGMQGLAD